MTRLTRTIEYEYDTAEDMAKDIASWTLRGQSWLAFNPKKRARQRITGVLDASDDGPGTIVPRGVADALDTAEHPDPQAQRVRDLTGVLRVLLDAIADVAIPDDEDRDLLAVLDWAIQDARSTVDAIGAGS